MSMCCICGQTGRAALNVRGQSICAGCFRRMARRGSGGLSVARRRLLLALYNAHVSQNGQES